MDTRTVIENPTYQAPNFGISWNSSCTVDNCTARSSQGRYRGAGTCDGFTSHKRGARYKPRAPLTGSGTGILPASATGCPVEPGHVGSCGGGGVVCNRVVGVENIPLPYPTYRRSRYRRPLTVPSCSWGSGVGRPVIWFHRPILPMVCGVHPEMNFQGSRSGLGRTVAGGGTAAGRGPGSCLLMGAPHTRGLSSPGFGS
jgi:hypothetical protein